MKKIKAAFLLIAFVPLLAFSGVKQKFLINGTIQGLQTGDVELTYRNLNGDDTILTAAIIAGKFTLSGQVPEPELARFSIRTGWPYSLSFFLENAPISFRLMKGFEDSTVVSGSASNLVYQQLEPGQMEFFAHARLYDAALQQATSAHSAIMQKNADANWQKQLEEWVNTIRAAIEKQHENYAALYFIKWLLFHPPAYDTIMVLFQSLAPDVRNGLAGKEFLQTLEHTHKTAIGQPAPEIVGTDTSGKPETLRALKGKVVLLDFWASYCSRCRQENPQLKAVYEKYHHRGFEILSFSLDYERAAWINAILRDQMDWHHASELRAGASASAGVYDVQDMPRNFLLDSKGNIVAKDLSPDDLNEKLSELTGKSGN
jgi:thiol-disulfide isomerase/thioredoxin